MSYVIEVRSKLDVVIGGQGSVVFAVGGEGVGSVEFEHTPDEKKKPPLHDRHELALE